MIVERAPADRLPRGDTASRRAVDVVVALVLLPFLLVLLVLLGLLVRCTSRGPALYRQWRVGRGMRPFTILKLRSMRVGADRTGALADGPAPRSAARRTRGSRPSGSGCAGRVWTNFRRWSICCGAR